MTRFAIPDGGSREAFVVFDLGFGDAGKGTIVDWLVRTHGAGLVVRWNGGAQAGHNVVTDDGRHHTFAQLGAGSFVPGARTHLAEPVVLHPTALLVEARRLEAAGVADALPRVTCAESARVVTPFHQAAGRLRELAREGARHGTCGVGVGETVRDALEHPDDVLRARDLAGDADALRRRLARVRDRLRAEILPLFEARPRGQAHDELAILEDAGVALRWMDAITPLSHAGVIVPDAALDAMLRDGPVVLEGAQGVLLDEWRGFHPHTTWSTCTPDAALDLLAAHGFDEPIRRLGVLRTYTTRHGEGPMPTHAPELSLQEPHNDDTGWQGRFRAGWLDLVLTRYALAAAGGADALAITHLDRLRAPWRAAVSYEGMGELPLGPPRDLAHQEGLTRALGDVHPRYDEVPLGDDPAAAFVDWIERALGVPVAIASSGPRARDKRAVRSLRSS